MLLSRGVAVVAAKAEARCTNTNTLRLLGITRSYQHNPANVRIQLQHLLHTTRFTESSTSCRSMSSSPWTTANFKDEDGSSNKEVIRSQRLYYQAVPKIRLTPFSSSSNQAHQSTVAGGGGGPGSSSSSSPSSPNNNSTTTTDSETFRERLQEQSRLGSKAARRGARSFRGMVQQYGPVFIGTYFTVYVSTVATLFVGVESGFLDPSVVLDFFIQNAADQQAEDSKSTVDMLVELLDHYSWTRPYAPLVEKNPTFAHLAVAWFATKFTEPIRLAVTVSVTPRLARYFGYVVKEVEDDPHPVVVDAAASSESKPLTDTESSSQRLASSEPSTTTAQPPQQHK
jgi:hypothetical protein